MKRYLVTGAAGGMGSAICRALHEAGNEVCGLDRTPPPAETPWRFLPADLTDPRSVRDAIAAIGEGGGLDGVIHAAGVYDLDSLIEIEEEAFLRVFNVNLFGVYRVNKAAAPFLNPGVRIVIVTSELAPLDPLPFTGIYAIAKGALEKYAYSLRMELQLLNIRVAVIRPGAVNTGMISASTRALERFSAGTKRYALNAARFRRIVDRAEARTVPPERIAGAVCRALSARRGRLVYNINRNPLLLLLNALPHRTQLWIIRKILK